jgi:hypothetical protein
MKIIAAPGFASFFLSSTRPIPATPRLGERSEDFQAGMQTGGRQGRLDAVRAAELVREPDEPPRRPSCQDIRLHVVGWRPSGLCPKTWKPLRRCCATAARPGRPWRTPGERPAGGARARPAGLVPAFAATRQRVDKASVGVNGLGRSDPVRLVCPQRHRAHRRGI